jgi:hypothetical protein
LTIKNYTIAILSVTVLLLISFIYKQHNRMVCHHFPIPESLKSKSDKTPLYLFLFFSKKDCSPCISNIINILNTLPSNFCIAGIAPEKDVMELESLRTQTGASFPLYSFTEFKTYLPWHTPTLFGVSPSGKILFVFPGILGKEFYIEEMLQSAYKKFQPSFRIKKIT